MKSFTLDSLPPWEPLAAPELAPPAPSPLKRSQGQLLFEPSHRAETVQNTRHEDYGGKQNNDDECRASQNDANNIAAITAIIESAAAVVKATTTS